jgi:hypothetical protein
MSGPPPPPLLPPLILPVDEVGPLTDMVEFFVLKMDQHHGLLLRDAYLKADKLCYRHD